MKNQLTLMRLMGLMGLMLAGNASLADPGSGTAVPVTATTGTANYAKTSGTAGLLSGGTNGGLSWYPTLSPGGSGFAEPNGRLTLGDNGSVDAAFYYINHALLANYTGYYAYNGQQFLDANANWVGPSIPAADISGTIAKSGTSSYALTANTLAANAVLSGSSGALQQIADTHYGYSYSGTTTSGTGAVNIILNTDIGTDCDQAGAIALLCHARDMRQANILAICCSGTAIWGPAAVSALTTYYGYQDIPIGMQETGTYQGADYYGSHISNNNQTGLLNYVASAPTATSVNRRALASAPDKSVTFVYAGVLTNLYNLWNSPADNISVLSGSNLLIQKAKQIIIMGGDYPAGNEYNFYSDPVSTQVINQMTGIPVTFIGYSLGAGLVFGPFQNQPVTLDPVLYAYSTFSYSRPSWDLMAVQYGLTGMTYAGTTVFNGSSGYNTVISTGSNAWVSGTGPQQYLTLATSGSSTLNSAWFGNLADNPARTPFLAQEIGNGYFQYRANTFGVGVVTTGTGVENGTVSSGTGQFLQALQLNGQVMTATEPGIIAPVTSGTLSPPNLPSGAAPMWYISSSGTTYLKETGTGSGGWYPAITSGTVQ